MIKLKGNKDTRATSVGVIIIIVSLLLTLVNHTTKLTFTCSKLTIEALEKDVKYVQSFNSKATEKIKMFFLWTDFIII